jgi:hypothetical protein
MEPILTLPYSEWLVAEKLMKLLSARDGYSVYAPLSRQEKGVDLLVTRRSAGESRAASIQVKYSRAYEQRAGYRFGIWFKIFAIPKEADFIVFAALYPTTDGRGDRRRSSWWASVMLLFTQEELAEFFASLRTRAGNPDRMFAFGFSTPDEIVLIRGTQDRTQPKFSSYLLDKRVAVIEKRLAAG